jgi:hypothetical protein
VALTPSTLWVATASGLFAGGARALGFTQLLGAPHPRGERLTVRAVDVDPAEPARVLAATADGVVRSTDGGRTFAPHPDLDDVEVLRFARDPQEPAHLFALAATTLFQSRDGGRHFVAAFSAEEGVSAVAIDERGAYIATGHGLVLPKPAVARWHPHERIVGVVALGEGWLLAASETCVWLIDDRGQARPLLRAGGDDPIARLEGSGAGAYVLTRHQLYRVTTEAVARLPAAGAPRVLLSLRAVEQAVLARAGVPDPARTRLGAPWWSFLLPRVTVSLAPANAQDFAVTYNALLPKSERRQFAGTDSCCGALPGGQPADFTVLATWNLAGLWSRKQPTYPFGLVEMSLRGLRDHLLSEVRWRYRDAVTLTNRLERPAADELQQVQWEARLCEQAAYLEAMAGRSVIAHPFE